MNLYDRLLECLYYEYTNNKIQNLDKEQILETIIPEIKDMKVIGECKYHVVNAYDHSINALDEFENMIRQESFFKEHIQNDIRDYLDTKIDDRLNKLQLLKLGVFLHDIGKPASRTVDDTGRVHFRGHEDIGSKIASKLGIDLGLTYDQVNLLCKYIKNHMTLLVLYKNNDLSQDKLFKIFDKLGNDTIGIMLLGYADIVATIRLTKSKNEIGVVKTYMEYVLTNYIYKYKILNKKIL